MPKSLIHLKINARDQELAVEPRWTLLETLRSQIGLTGTKEGCGTGDCGACSVFVDGSLITSCCMLAVQADGREIITIEGLARNGNLDPVQQAFVDAGGVQCGFCTPGMIMATKNLLDHNPSPDLDAIRQGLAGNLCRCTGYTKIYEAVQAAGRQGA